MGFIELVFIAIGLSMDAFAVSIVKGLNMRKLNLGQAALIALFFGGFQALMPLLGWLLGIQFQHYIESVDHWIAFVLLAFIGAKMIFDALRSEKGSEPDAATRSEQKLDIKELFLLAIATSIDALAIGITFAFLQVDIVPAALLIGLVTFVLAFGGVIVGNRFGAKYEKGSMIVGGVVLILIGFKILLEHLGFL
ncbi:MAG: manganese efflux pump MntP family protein [Raoultibacter sp.]